MKGKILPFTVDLEFDQSYAINRKINIFKYVKKLGIKGLLQIM